jgi:flagellar motor switch protein FliG
MNEKTIVLTMYGTGEVIDNVTVTLFDKSSNYGSDQAQDYCNNINELELKDYKWIHAVKIKENKKIMIEKPRRITDFSILCSLDDQAIQKIVREIDNNLLALALKSTDKNMLIAVLRNMSKRAAKTLIEDMKNMLGISQNDIQDAREKITSIIQHLEDVGEIVVPKFNQNEN